MMYFLIHGVVFLMGLAPSRMCSVNTSSRRISKFDKFEIHIIYMWKTEALDCDSNESRSIMKWTVELRKEDSTFKSQESRQTQSKRESIKNWTHWELNPTPLAYHVLWTNSRRMLSERDNQLHHVPPEL
jgi:hypothetical protein